MIARVTDSLVRRILFGYTNFFKNVKIRDATRAPFYMQDGIELPQSYIAPYLPEEQDVHLLLEDATINRLESQKFSLSTDPILTYRKDLEEIITITIGSREDGFDRNELRKIIDFAKPSFCGSYLIQLTVPLPENLFADTIIGALH